MLCSFCYHFRFMKNMGENVVRIEAEALRALADRLAGPMAHSFERALDLLFRCQGRVVVTGMGKERDHCAEDRRDFEFDRIARALSSSGGSAARRSRDDRARRRRGRAFGQRGDGRNFDLLATIKRLQVPLIAMTCDEMQAFGVSARLGCDNQGEKLWAAAGADDQRGQECPRHTSINARVIRGCGVDCSI